MDSQIAQWLARPEGVAAVTSVASAVATVVLRVVAGRAFRADWAEWKAARAMRARREAERALAEADASLAQVELRRAELRLAELRRAAELAERHGGEGYRSTSQGTPSTGGPRSSQVDWGDGSEWSRSNADVKPSSPRAAWQGDLPGADRAPRPEVVSWLARLVEDVANVDVLPPPPRVGERRRDRETARHAHVG